MAGSGKLRPPTAELDFTTAEFPTYYAQEAVVGSSFYDFSLVFVNGSIRGRKPVASVTFPPAMAKQLAALLQANIQRYEATFGEIKLPPTAPIGPGYEGGIS